MDSQQFRSNKELNKRYWLLKAWYGKERADVEMAAHCPEATEISAVIHDICKDFSNPDNGAFVEISSRWNEIVRQPVCDFAKPISLHDGVLTLQVRHSALLAELTPSLDLILLQIQKHIGANYCSEVKLTCGGGSGWRKNNGEITEK